MSFHPWLRPALAGLLTLAALAEAARAQTSGNPVPSTDVVVTLRDIPPMQARSGETVVPLTIQETTGQPAQVEVPQLVGLTRDTGEQVKLGADARWTVLEAPSSKAELKRPFRLQGLRTLGLRLQGLGWPGKYEGTVIVPYGDQTVEKGLTVYSRWSALVAFVLIALGVGVSWLLRKYLAEGRPRLVEERRGEILLRSSGLSSAAGPRRSSAPLRCARAPPPSL